METIAVLLLLLSMLAFVGCGITGLVFLLFKKNTSKKMFTYTGIAFGTLIVAVIMSAFVLKNQGVSIVASEEVELSTDEAHDVIVALKDWEDPADIYLGEVWQETDDQVLQASVKTIAVTEKDIAKKELTVTNTLSENQARKLVTVALEETEAKAFVQDVMDTYKENPIELEDMDTFIAAAEDTLEYVSYINSDVKAANVLALEQAEKEAEEKAAAEKEKAEEKEKKAQAKKEKAAKEKEEKKQANKKLAGMKVHFIDVGQADAALIQYDNRAILIDAGDWNRNEVVPYLQNQGIKKLDLVVGSHPHADHIGQIDKVIDHFDVEEVWMSGGASSSNVFERVITAIDNNNISYDEPRAGDTFTIGDLKIDIVSPSSITGNLNDDSIVMKLTYGAVSFLFTGDAETPAENRMVSSGQSLSATILKVGHHGSDTSTTQGFLDKVNPKVAVMSVAEKSKYDHPDKSVVDRINNKGIDLYATKTHGNIVITTDGTSYDIQAAKSGTVTAGKSGKKTSEKKQASSKQTTNSKTETKKENKPKKESKPKKQEPSANCVDINSASESELQNIKHIGPATAPKVIDARPFNSVDQLTRVSGIAEKRIADIKAEGIACVK